MKKLDIQFREPIFHSFDLEDVGKSLGLSGESIEFVLNYLDNTAMISADRAIEQFNTANHNCSDSLVAFFLFAIGFYNGYGAEC